MLNSILSEQMQFFQALICLLVTAVMSIAFSVIYCFLKQRDGYTKDIPLTFALLPVIVTGLTLMIFYAMTEVVGETTITVRYGRVAVALLSAFIVVKFRSQQRTTEDLTYIVFLTGIGLINGLGYIYFNICLYVLFLIVFILLHVFHFPFMCKRNLNLKITIPEDLNYENAFDDLFNEYTTYNNLTKIKTSDMGTMFVLNYEIVLKKGKSTKQLIDSIRQRNGNLNVVLTVKKFTSLDN